MDKAVRLTEEIKPHAGMICKLANGGCEKSKALIDAHRMMAEMPDSGAIGVCRAAFYEWRNLHAMADQ